MSADNSNNGAPPPNQHHRRGSINPGTSPVTSLLQHRRNSLALGITPPTLFASQSMPAEPHHRRHTSVSATLGLASSPNSTFDFRRSSISTNGDSIDESAIEDNDRNPPVAHFARRMTVQPIRGIGGSISGGSPISGNNPRSVISFFPSSNSPVVGNNQAPEPPAKDGSRPKARRHSVGVAASAVAGPFSRPGSTPMESSDLPGPGDSKDPSQPRPAFDAGTRGRRGSSGIGSLQPPIFATLSNPFAHRNQDQGSSYNWGDHLRARAQSSVNGTRPVFGTSPPGDPAPRAAAAPQMTTEMPHPPTQPARPRPEQRPKPDAYQERILKGDFYMD